MLRRTQDPEQRVITFDYKTITLFRAVSQQTSSSDYFGNSNVQSYNPKKQASWFGLFPLRSPLLWESIFLSFPVGT